MARLLLGKWERKNSLLMKENEDSGEYSIFAIIFWPSLIVMAIIARWWMFFVILGGILLLFFGFICLMLLALRDHYGMDFISSCKAAFLFFKRRGYEYVEYFGAGSARAGLTLAKPSCENVKIIVHYPIIGRCYLEVVEDNNDSINWEFNKKTYDDIDYIEKTLSPYFGEATIEDKDIKLSRFEKYIQIKGGFPSDPTEQREGETSQ